MTKEETAIEGHKKEAVFHHSSCKVTKPSVEGEPRSQRAVHTSDIGVVTSTISFPNELGSANQGKQEHTEVLSNYTGPDFNEHGIEV